MHPDIYDNMDNMEIKTKTIYKQSGRNPERDYAATERHDIRPDKEKLERNAFHGRWQQSD